MCAAARNAMLAAGLLIALAQAGCSGGAAIDASNAGKSASYQPGLPGFDMEALPAPGDSLSAIDLFLSIPYPSLIFEKVPGGFRARFDITARVTERQSTQLAREVAWTDTSFVEHYAITQSFAPILVRKRIGVMPGAYRVDVTVEDLNSGGKTVRAQAVRVEDPTDMRPALGRISLRARGSTGEDLPQISFFVPERADSATCRVEAYNFTPGAASRIDISVLHFPGDTSIATPPFYFSVLPIPLGHSVIDFDRPDTVWSSVKTLRAAHRDEPVDFRIPPLRRGMYRIDIGARTQTAAMADTAIAAGRYYSVQGPGFPRPVTYAEMLQAATYLATEKELASMRQASTPDEQRKKFESFWLSLTGDAARASALIRKYYGRVEEANRLFSIVKEGWRTDRGMLYCILGPPADVTNHLDTQTWYYDLSGNAADNTYVFKRVVKQGEGLTLEEYILYRQATYENFWTRALVRWRSGEPL